MKRQKKKQKSSEDSDTDDIFASKQNPVSIITDRCIVCKNFSLIYSTFVDEEEKEEGFGF